MRLFNPDQNTSVCNVLAESKKIPVTCKFYPTKDSEHYIIPFVAAEALPRLTLPESPAKDSLAGILSRNAAAGRAERYL